MHGLGDLFGVLDGGKDSECALVNFATDFRQMQRPGAALEQTHAEFGFEFADLSADSCLLAAKQLGGAGEAAALDHTDESA